MLFFCIKEVIHYPNMHLFLSEHRLSIVLVYSDSLLLYVKIVAAIDPAIVKTCDIIGR